MSKDKLGRKIDEVVNLTRRRRDRRDPVIGLKAPHLTGDPFTARLFENEHTAADGRIIEQPMRAAPPAPPIPQGGPAPAAATPGQDVLVSPEGEPVPGVDTPEELPDEEPEIEPDAEPDPDTQIEEQKRALFNTLSELIDLGRIERSEADIRQYVEEHEDEIGDMLDVLDDVIEMLVMDAEIEREAKTFDDKDEDDVESTPGQKDYDELKPGVGSQVPKGITNTSVIASDQSKPAGVKLSEELAISRLMSGDNVEAVLDAAVGEEVVELNFTSEQDRDQALVRMEKVDVPSTNLMKVGPDKLHVVRDDRNRADVEQQMDALENLEYTETAQGQSAEVEEQNDYDELDPDSMDAEPVGTTEVWQNVAFSQGDEAGEILDIISQQGPEAALDFLAEAGYTDLEGETMDDEPWGEEDDVFHDEESGLILSWNDRLGYWGIARKVAGEPEAQEFGEAPAGATEAKKKYALDPAEREKDCPHTHGAWSGRVPNTGTFKCSMCGTELDPKTKKPIGEDYMESEGKEKIARWQTRGGKYWYELYQDESGFTYRGDNAGGNLGDVSREEAIATIEKKVRDHKAIDGINMTRVSGSVSEQTLSNVDPNTAIDAYVLKEFQVRGGTADPKAIVLQLKSVFSEEASERSIRLMMGDKLEQRGGQVVLTDRGSQFLSSILEQVNVSRTGLAVQVAFGNDAQAAAAKGALLQYKGVDVVVEADDHNIVIFTTDTDPEEARKRVEVILSNARLPMEAEEIKNLKMEIFEAGEEPLGFRYGGADLLPTPLPVGHGISGADDGVVEQPIGPDLGRCPRCGKSLNQYDIKMGKCASCFKDLPQAPAAAPEPVAAGAMLGAEEGVEEQAGPVATQDEQKYLIPFHSPDEVESPPEEGEPPVTEPTEPEAKSDVLWRMDVPESNEEYQRLETALDSAKDQGLIVNWQYVPPEEEELAGPEGPAAEPPQPDDEAPSAEPVSEYRWLNGDDRVAEQEAPIDNIDDYDMDGEVAASGTDNFKPPEELPEPLPGDVGAFIAVEFASETDQIEREEFVEWVEQETGDEAAGVAGVTVSGWEQLIADETGEPGMGKLEPGVEPPSEELVEPVTEPVEPAVLAHGPEGVVGATEQGGGELYGKHDPVGKHQIKHFTKGAGKGAKIPWGQKPEEEPDDLFGNGERTEIDWEERTADGLPAELKKLLSDYQAAKQTDPQRAASLAGQLKFEMGTLGLDPKDFGITEAEDEEDVPPEPSMSEDPFNKAYAPAVRQTTGGGAEPAGESCPTPGERIRSRGQGKGLARGKGRGPIGRPSKA